MSRPQGIAIVSAIGIAILVAVVLLGAPTEKQVCEHVLELLRQSDSQNGSDMESEGRFDAAQLHSQCVSGLGQRRAGVGFLEYREQARCIVAATKLTHLGGCSGQSSD